MSNNSLNCVRKTHPMQLRKFGGYADLYPNEALVAGPLAYPVPPRLRLNHVLLGYLNNNSYTAVWRKRWPCYPRSLCLVVGRNLPDEPLKERHRFYDDRNGTNRHSNPRASGRLGS